MDEIMHALACWSDQCLRFAGLFGALFFGAVVVGLLIMDYQWMKQVRAGARQDAEEKNAGDSARPANPNDREATQEETQCRSSIETSRSLPLTTR